MRIHHSGIIVLALTACHVSRAEAQEKPTTLTWKTYDKVRDYVLPTEKEIGWQAIPWRSDFGQALAEASHKDMPLLIWAMNGDPLGCT
jgi:hypothetical protein